MKRSTPATAKAPLRELLSCSSPPNAPPHVNVTRETLKQRYSDLVDDELLRRLRSGVLTELARDVALEEVAARGLNPDAPSPDASPAINPELEFAEDEFDRNPYQAPRLTTQASPQPAVPLRRRIADLLWFAYVTISVYLILAEIFLALEHNAIRDMFGPSVIFSASALGGIVAWRLRIALLNPLIWVGCFAVNLVLLADYLKNYYEFAATDSTGYSEIFLPTMLAGLAAQAPMYWGLACYAFGSRAIWAQRSARRAESASGADA